MHNLPACDGRGLNLNPEVFMSVLVGIQIMHDFLAVHFEFETWDRPLEIDICHTRLSHLPSHCQRLFHPATCTPSQIVQRSGTASLHVLPHTPTLITHSALSLITHSSLRPSLITHSALSLPCFTQSEMLLAASSSAPFSLSKLVSKALAASLFALVGKSISSSVNGYV